MKRISLAFFFVVCSLFLTSCGSTAKSIPGADVTGNWNVDLTETGQTVPSYSFGLRFTKNTTNISGNEIAYTGGTQHNVGCVNFGGLTATGGTNGASVITLVVTDPSTHSTLTVSGTADAAVQQINGTFDGSFGANGSNPPCPSTNGTVLMNRQ
jgi:predicted small secreted protein